MSNNKWSEIVAKRPINETIIEVETEPPTISQKKIVQNWEREWSQQNITVPVPVLIPTATFLKRRKYDDYDKFIPLTMAETEYEEMCEEIRTEMEYWDKKYEKTNKYFGPVIINEDIVTPENTNNNLSIENDDDSNYEDQ